MLNEGSFNRALGEYDRQGDGLTPPSIASSLITVLRLKYVRHFTYVAINPTRRRLDTLLYDSMQWFESITMQSEPGPKALLEDRWQGAWLDDGRDPEFAQADKFAHLLRILDSAGPCSPLAKFEILGSKWDFERLWTLAGFDNHRSTRWAPSSKSVLKKCALQSGP